MAAPTSYAELVDEIENHAHRGDIDADIPMLIQKGEARINRKLRAREMIASTNITTSIVNNYVDLPTGFIELISFSDDLGDKMIEVSFEELEDIRYGIGSNRPQVYSLGSRIDFDRVSGTARSYPMRYWKKLDVINSDSVALSLLAKHPDLYINATMLELAAFKKEDSRVTLWAEMLDTTIKEINHRDTNHKRIMRSGIMGNRLGRNILNGWY